MKVICKDDSYTFRNMLTIGKEYEVLKSYNDPYEGYLMFDIECDNGNVRTYRANRFTFCDEEIKKFEAEQKQQQQMEQMQPQMLIEQPPMIM